MNIKQHLLDARSREIAAEDLALGKPDVPRSPHWPEVEHGHLLKQPCCAVCGGKDQLNVHHLKPYHLFPELELADGTGKYCQLKDAAGSFVNNLITLCNGRMHHITFGHAGDFKAYNPSGDSSIAAAHFMFNRRQYTRDGQEQTGSEEITEIAGASGATGEVDVQADRRADS